MFAMCQALAYMGCDATMCTSRPLLLVLGMRDEECRNGACWEASRRDNTAR